MEAKTKVKIESLEPFRHLFPAARVVDKTVKMGATVSDTVDFIPQIVRSTQWQVEKCVEQELRGLSDYAACEKLWHFVKFHIRYERDKRGKEQVRSPRRLIHDGKGDCDCMTTFVSACLTAYKIDGDIILRITKYEEDYFQHIYPVVMLRNGQQIIMDCVADAFNYEVPYTEKKDFKMELQYLDGIEDEKTFAGNVDAQDLFGWDEFGDLGRRSKRSHSSSAMPEENQGGKKGKKGFQKFKKVAKRFLNVTNRVNPATAVLRAGILASMKLNIFKVAQKLKWAYLSENEARAKGADMGKFGKLKNVLYKIEQIFYTAGGKPENLKKAILSGRGNRNKEVSGFGLIDSRDIELSGYDNYTPMPQLLGEIYQDEFVHGLEGTDGLGVIATSAAVAAASTVMGTIAALLKSIGNLFPKKASNDFTEDGGSGGGDNSNGGGDDSNQPTVTTNSRSNNSGGGGSSSGGGGGGGSSESNSETPATNNESSTPPAEQNDNSNAQGRQMQKSGDEGSGDEGNTNGTAREKSATGDETEEKGFKTFWDKNKKWMKPVGIGLGVAAILYGGYRIVKSNKEKKKAPTSNGQAALNGYSRHKHKTKKKKSGGGKKSSIALM